MFTTHRDEHNKLFISYEVSTAKIAGQCLFPFYTFLYVTEGIKPCHTFGHKIMLLLSVNPRGRKLAKGFQSLLFSHHRTTRALRTFPSQHGTTKNVLGCLAMSLSSNLRAQKSLNPCRRSFYNGAG